MSRNAGPTIGLALLLVTAGCAGLFPGADGTATPTPGPPDAYDAAVQNHSEALRSAGQFKLRERIAQEFGEGGIVRPPVTRAVVADLEADQYWMAAELEPVDGVYLDGSLYQSGDAVYRRIERDDAPPVFRRVPPADTAGPRNLSLDSIRIIRAFTRQFPLEPNGTAVFRGERMTRFSADEFGRIDRCIPWLIESVGSVSDVQVTVLVDDRGIIRKFDCRLDGELVSGDPYTERMVWTITGLDAVEVRAPDRLVNETPAG